MTEKGAGVSGPATTGREIEGAAFYHHPVDPLPVEAEELWEVNSGWWQRKFTEGADPEYTEQIIPLLRDHLEQVAPRSVLDIGCGEGQLSRLAAGLPGVRRVVGVDPTGAQLRAAVARQLPAGAGRAGTSQAGVSRAGTGRAGLSQAGVSRAGTGRAGLVSYARAAAGALPFPDATFDAAFACLVFEHIEGTAGALAEVGRVLRPQATFLLFLNHPLLQVPGSGWVDDHILEEQYWRIGPYLVEHHGVEEVDRDVWIPFVHRPLSVYVNGLAAAGLYLTGMVEPAPPPGFLERAHEYQEAAAFPRLLVLRAEKLVRRRARAR
jgi:SAM-dependent methyltransferase